jgi:thiol:disulfide interchange protein DsbA
VRWLLPVAGLAAAAALVVGAIVLTGSEPISVQDVPVVSDVPDTAPPVTSPARSILGDSPIVEPAARDFVAGVHYQVLATPVPTMAAAGQIEVCEFFMFTCPHCFSLEPFAEDWAERQDQTVAFEQVPVLWNELARLHAQAFYTAEALGRRDDIVAPMFAEIHERGNALASVDEIRAFFFRQGISADEFDSAFTSRRVEDSLRRAAELNDRYGIDSTPTLTINGRFVTGPSMVDSYAGVFDVVDALVESERDAPAPARLDLIPASPGSASQASSLQELIDLTRSGERR